MDGKGSEQSAAQPSGQADVLTEQVHIYCTPAEKAAWLAAAQGSGHRKLSAYARWVLNHSSGLTKRRAQGQP